ncbi:CPBP family intramembrane glutamic endopeptidase [Loigolactobacillus backii]|nr:CPBP family intramembrane glutamic endopeptidase [Loigolactobacillus backii]MDA5388791.1 CPBP family intramembrane metalloprotease [Loigolactobacillus backii]MDA5391292.1 CPBP family intramembrane metalloprotease [Loigolactobacillus backii]
MVIPIFVAAYFIPNRGILVQTILAVICSALGAGTVFLLASQYENAIKQRNPLRVSLASIFKERPWKFSLTLIILIIWLAVQYFWPGQASADQNATANLLAMYPVPIFIVVSVFGPIYEELLSRGIFFAYFVKSGAAWAQWTGLIVSAILFGLLHSVTISWATLGYIISGLVLGMIYLLTKNIRFSILAHLLSNVLATLL